MLTLGEVIDAVVTQGGFDTSSSATPDVTVRGWIHEALQQALADSKFRHATINLGPAVAGVDHYAVPDNVVELRSLRIGSGLAYAPLAGIEDMWSLQAATSRIWPGGFLLTQGDDGDTDATQDTSPQVQIYPAPGSEADGMAIQAIGAVLPPAITQATATSYVIPLPADVERAIAIDGAIAIGKQRVYERDDLAAPFQKRRDDAVEKLLKRANARVRGRAQLRLVRPRAV